MTMKFYDDNHNCDGSGPHVGSESRVLPIGGEGNLILCIKCFRNEMHWRKRRNKELGTAFQFNLPEWQTLEIYNYHGTISQ